MLNIMQINILTIPDVALETILSFLTYHEIAKYRLVCQKFNELCGQLLTRGFSQVVKRHTALHKKMRAQLPRRESERRSHPLAKRCDILTAVETRISMLSMTYYRHMDSKICCFIPGKVLDEIIIILNIVETAEYPPRTNELLQELRDISSMATEHFDDAIAPLLDQKFENVFFTIASSSKPTPNVMPLKQVFSDEVNIYKKQTNLHKHQMHSLVKSLKRLEIKFKGQTKLLHKSAIKVKQQARILNKQKAKLKEQGAIIAELKKHVEEWDHKLADLISKLVRAQEEQLGNTKPPITTSLKDFHSNIKPRVPILKYSELSTRSDFERKRKSQFISSTVTSAKMPRRLDDAKIASVINKTLTKNISKSFIESNVSIPKLNKSAINKSSDFSKMAFGGFLSNTIEKIIKSPIISIKSRKQKMSGEIEFI